MKPRTHMTGKRRRGILAAGVSALLWTATVHAELQVTNDWNPSTEALPGFQFEHITRPAKNDAASNAVFSLVEGRRDRNGGDLNRLHDGQLPTQEDQPGANLFFEAGSEGGRLQIDLGRVIEIARINVYSWHPGTRGPQVFTLYASDGAAEGFDGAPLRGKDPAACGWRLLTRVDTRPASGEGGGQHGVSITDSAGTLGRHRYLLFDILPTERTDPFGNTFFSEIDVVDRDAPAPEPVDAPVVNVVRDIIKTDDGKFTIVLDTSEAPDLTDWARQTLGPMAREWYPKLARTLSSDGYEAPLRCVIGFAAGAQGVADTSGAHIRCSKEWFRGNLDGEAKGAVFHELVHVVQNYGRAPRGSPAPPGWLTEGIADYLRWYVFEPEKHGAEINRRNLDRARYDASYRVTANFLNWVTTRHGAAVVPGLNAALREGRYRDELWNDLTGESVQELGTAWKAELERTLGAAPAP